MEKNRAERLIYERLRDHQLSGGCNELAISATFVATPTGSYDKSYVFAITCLLYIAIAIDYIDSVIQSMI